MTLKSINRMKTLFAVVVAFVLVGAALPATYTVTNNNDSGDYSLRWAIESANNDPGRDLIAFNIPSTGLHTIKPLTPLPKITDPVTIDGYTQPGASPATYGGAARLQIELDGINLIGLHWDSGLNIWLVGNSTIRGLVINRFGDVGIHIHDGGGNIIEGNYIGTDVTGTQDKGNYDGGIRIWNAPNNRIGGTSPAARNVISGNDGSGVGILLPNATGNKILGNYIGIDASGTKDLGNEFGVVMYEGTSNNTVGPGNVISCNGDTVYGGGIDISGEGTTTNQLIVGNLIGTNASGSGVLGNTYGVRLMDCSGNTVKDNIVSNSNIVGITIACDPSRFSVHDNTVTGNTICSNAVFGIQIEFSDDNLIYNNSLISNGYMNGNLQIVDHAGVNNVFNLEKPLGGNYWSDWTGPDDNGDGFVDEPYVIWTPEGPYGEYGNQDNLPWASEDSWRNGCLIQQLIVQVEELDLPKGTENSLMAKLENAAKKLNDQNISAAINSLNAFINEVEAQRGKSIPVTDADALIDAAQAIIDLLESM